MHEAGCAAASTPLSSREAGCAPATGDREGLPGLGACRWVEDLTGIVQAAGGAADVCVHGWGGSCCVLGWCCQDAGLRLNGAAGDWLLAKVLRQQAACREGKCVSCKLCFRTPYLPLTDESRAELCRPAAWLVLRHGMPAAVSEAASQGGCCCVSQRLLW